MKAVITVLILALIITAAFFFLQSRENIEIPEGESIPPKESSGADEKQRADETTGPKTEGNNNTLNEGATKATSSSREIFVTDGVKHSVPLDEIRQGCFGRDCIPSVDEPEFIPNSEAEDLLPENAVGIGLSHKGEKRFYPFDMLVTREIVNDTIAGDPLVVTYCPLCGTGIVFDRKVGGETVEFGVSGMLWQSNLLMYNRAGEEDDISLWSQVLGEAVLGPNTGTKLSIVPSDIVLYKDWVKVHPETIVLNTGRIGDPYEGDYYSVARGFSPDYDEESSPLPPTTQVIGIEVNGKYKAYVKDSIPVGSTEDTFAETKLVLERSEAGEFRVYSGENRDPVNILSGFWFSWVAAHPTTELYN